MIQLLKMSIRDLARNRRRSIFSALALGMGLALLMLMASVIAGEMRGAMNTSIRLATGHLQVRAKTYDEVKNSLAYEDLIANPAQVAAQVAALAPVKAATPRLFATGIVASPDQSVGVRIIGIDPASAANAPYRDGLVSGAYLTADDNSGVLIGQRLADKLGLKANDPIQLLVNTSNGDVDQQTFTIRGTYSTHTPSFDQGNLFLPLAKAQAITKTENHASTIFVLLNNIDQTSAVASALQSTQYQIKTYLQLNDLLVQTESLANASMIFFYLIVLGIVATVIVNTLIMSVFERTREIGILSAIGMKSGRIMMLFFIESCLLAVGGIAIGLIVGGIGVYFASTVGLYLGSLSASVHTTLLGERIYAYITVQDVVNLTIIAFIVALLAALYPAFIASRMEPVKALHGGE